ncbi:hypothetical protein [Cylindrospermopsis raciborskii]|uniref:hypothetical protein n=1 Tax=Cylindrospermopsis raciborskii TaxID=77022 RepID=UPI0015E0C863|nr:hypothetical protein [Cylindrospermopsis raciborskii]
MHSLWEIALSDYPSIPSQGKILNVLRGAHCTRYGRSHYTPDGRSPLDIILRFLLKGKF